MIPRTSSPHLTPQIPIPGTLLFGAKTIGELTWCEAMPTLGLGRKQNPSDNPTPVGGGGGASTHQSRAEVEQGRSPKTLDRRKASLLASCAGTALSHALDRRYRRARGL